MGIDFEKGSKRRTKSSREGEDRRRAQRAANEADRIFLATDPDAKGSHRLALAEELKSAKKPTQRVEFTR